MRLAGTPLLFLGLMVAALLMAGCSRDQKIEKVSGAKKSSQPVKEQLPEHVVRSYGEKMFASSDDLYLVSQLFKKMTSLSDGSKEEDLKRMSEPQRVVLEVWGTSNIVGNGGFRFLFETSLIDFAGIADSYEKIGSTDVAAVVRRALALFPDSAPQTNVDKRFEYLDGLGEQAKKTLEECDSAFFKADRRTTRLLAAYARKNQSSLVEVIRPNQSDVDEINQRDLPPPPSDSDVETVTKWLTTIGATTYRLSQREMKYGKITDGSKDDPIVDIEMGPYRHSTDADVATLVQYEVLKSVRALDLRDTEITAEGLRSLHQLPRLQRLELQQTAIGDKGLEWLVAIKELSELRLARTKTSDAGLAVLAKIPSLRSLDLSFTGLTGTGLVELGKLSELRDLHLSGCASIENDFSWITQLKGLETLNVGKVPLQDVAMEPIGKLSELTFLDLSGTKITDEGLSKLAGLTKLKLLFLGATSIDGHGFKSLNGLQALETLSLQQTEINDEAATEIATLSNLKELILTETKISDAGVEQLAKLVGLRLLKLGGTRVQGGPAFEGLAKLEDLGRLTLPAELKAGTPALKDLQQKLPKLKVDY